MSGVGVITFFVGAFFCYAAYEAIHTSTKAKPVTATPLLKAQSAFS